jgi:D-alanine-D-alanine ligase
MLLVGGPSLEKEISLASADNIQNALESLGYKVSIIDPSETSLIDNLRSLTPDIVFNGMHGTYGEDGLVQSLLEITGVPYTHSGVLPSAAAMNKTLTKKLAIHHGIETPKFIEMDCRECMEKLQSGQDLPIPIPFVLKPIDQGSTIGIMIVRHHGEMVLLRDKIKKWHHGKNILVEEYIPGRELSVGILQNKPLGIIEIITSGNNNFYDYRAKYLSNQTQYTIPADIPKEVQNTVMEWAQTMHSVLGCKTISRSDFRYNDNLNSNDNNNHHNTQDKLHFLELNTHPGLGAHSLIPKIAKYQGISFAELIQILIKDASCQHQNILSLQQI